MDGHTTKPRELKIADEKKKTKAFKVLIESQDNEAGVPIPEDLCLDESSVGHCSDPRTAAGRETVTHCHKPCQKHGVELSSSDDESTVSHKRGATEVQ